MTVLLSNVFYDSSSPWYYVIGVVFLILIFGALTAYIMLSKKFGKDKKQESGEPSETENGATASPNSDSDSGAGENGEINADSTNAEPSDNQ